MLTETAIRALKPAEKEYKKADSSGLHLLVKPSGSKLWRLVYRFNDKQKTLVGGKYPNAGLADCVPSSSRTILLVRSRRPFQLQIVAPPLVSTMPGTPRFFPIASRMKSTSA